MCEVISEVSFYSLFQLTEGEFFYDDNEKIKTKENFCISHTSFFIIIQEKKNSTENSRCLLQCHKVKMAKVITKN